jgi:transaldolase
MALWLDGLSRQVLDENTLARLVRDQGVTGAVTNPVDVSWSLSNQRYDQELKTLAADDVGPDEALGRLLTSDARAAADLLLPVFHASGGAEGWVTVDGSLGAPCGEADDPAPPTVDALRADVEHLRDRVDRPNVLVALPPSPAGLGAATAALADGLPVNVTPVFSPGRYCAAVDAVLAGLRLSAETDAGEGTRIMGVVSVGVNQIDTEVDKQLWKIGNDECARLRGQAALANAGLVRSVHDDLTRLDRWRSLVDQGHPPPRLAWVATGVRDPYYAPTHYLDALAREDGMVVSAPEAVLAALSADAAGVVTAPTAAGTTTDAAQATMAAIGAVGVDLDATLVALDDGGIERYSRAWQVARATVSVALER